METEKFNLKAEIKSIGMTQRDFAKHIDKSVFTITRWVKNEIEMPKVIELYIKDYKKARLFEQLNIR